MIAENSGARAWWGQLFEWDDYELAETGTAEHGAGAWMCYTEEQITSVLQLLEALFRGIPTLKDITTHWYVAPGRKVDTNPLFPLQHIRAKVLGRDDPAEAAADDASAPIDVGRRAVIRAASGLNMRRWPSFNPNVILTIPNGTEVPVLREGDFAGRTWLRVLYAGQEGWIVADYAEQKS